MKETRKHDRIIALDSDGQSSERVCPWVSELPIGHKHHPKAFTES